MYHNNLPIQLHQQAEQFIVNLHLLCHRTPECCPYCNFWDFYSIDKEGVYFRCKACKKGFNTVTGTEFHRLVPLSWLPDIAAQRLAGIACEDISKQLGCTINKVKRRDEALLQMMKKQFPELYQWITGSTRAPTIKLPAAIEKQYKGLKQWVHDSLTKSVVECHYCNSSDVLKSGQSGGFRCRTCQRYFNPLKGTGLDLLKQRNEWHPFLEQLIVGYTDEELHEKLNMTINVIKRYRRIWFYIMHNQGFDALRQWVIDKQNEHYLSIKLDAERDIKQKKINSERGFNSLSPSL